MTRELELLEEMAEAAYTDWKYWEIHDPVLAVDYEASYLAIKWSIEIELNDSSMVT